MSSERKKYTNTLNVELCTKLKKLAWTLSAQSGNKINANDLIEEGIELVLKKYETRKHDGLTPHTYITDELNNI